MTDNTIPENRQPAPLLGLGSSAQLGPLPPTCFTLASGGGRTWVRGWSEQQLRAYAMQAVAAERERCAALVDPRPPLVPSDHEWLALERAANRIREV